MTQRYQAGHHRAHEAAIVSKRKYEFASRQKQIALQGTVRAYVKSKRNEIAEHVWQTGRGFVVLRVKFHKSQVVE